MVYHNVSTAKSAENKAFTNEIFSCMVCVIKHKGKDMKTEVIFAKRGSDKLMAYTNAKGQNVFLPIVQADIAPRLGEVIIVDKTYDIQDVVQRMFELDIYKKQTLEIGIKEKHIWKPLLIGDMGKELDYTVYELCKAKRDLSVLIQKLQEILLYVEPATNCLQTYSHKLRELLILACTEFECSFKGYNFGNNERTSDYIKILDFVDLKKYKIELAGYSETFQSMPFANWNSAEPTKSLPWYYAYTQTKHNKTGSFNLATLENCINAICANIIMFTIRYSPHSLYNEMDVCSSLIRNTFALRIEDTEDIYIPIIEGERSYSGAFSNDISFKNGEVLRRVFDVQRSLPFKDKETE